MGQLLFEEETVVRELFWCIKITAIAVITKLCVAAVLFSKAERQINGTAAAGQPANGADAKALLYKAALLRKGSVINFAFNWDVRQLLVALLSRLSCAERNVDSVVASEKPAQGTDAAAALGLQGIIVARTENQTGIEIVPGIVGELRAKHMHHREMANI